MSQPLTWLVGAGGLLGQHVATGLAHRRTPRLPAPRVPWSQPAEAQRILRDTGRRLREEAGSGPWQLLWCAGAGVTGTSQQDLDLELDALRAALAGLAEGPGGAGEGAVFFTSSAGGVYAGVGAPPYDEFSPVAPLAPYGHAKLAAERIVREWAAGSGVRALVGRIANLYGPGQNLSKAQGLVSQLCAGYVRRQPNHIWSPLDTIRDYIYVTDCAELILDAMDRLRAEPESVVVTKVLASGQAMTIGSILGDLRPVFKRRPQIVLGASPVTAFQALDLSLRSVVWPELDRRAWTPFVVGALATLDDLRTRFAAEGAL